MERSIKGFTLAELMGVIVILAVLAVILVPVVDRNLKKGKNITCDSQEKSIIEAAKNYTSDNVAISDNAAPCAKLLANKGGSCEVTVKELVQKGYLEGSSTTGDTAPINPGTNEPYTDQTFVLISNVTGYNYTYNLMYEGKDEGSCN